MRQQYRDQNQNRGGSNSGRRNRSFGGGRDYDTSRYGTQDFQRGFEPSQEEYGQTGYGPQTDEGYQQNRNTQNFNQRRYDDYGRNEDSWSRYGHGASSRHREYGTPDYGPHQGKGPKGFRRDDNRIREEVNDALEQDSWVDASEIEVQVKDGIVTLTGTVDSRQTKRRAEDCVEDVRGVKDVTNNLQVQSNQQSTSRMDRGENASSFSMGSGSNMSGNGGEREEERSGGSKARNKLS
jgi:osmotically-inducible protein OsmY